MSPAYDWLEDYAITLSQVPLPGPWARKGRCRTAPSNVFFPGRGESLDQAKAICRLCPVSAECLVYALEAGDRLQGVWGGTSARERRDMQNAQSEPPPPVKAKRTASERGSLDRVLKQLTAHPGQWARVGHYANVGSASSMASVLRSGRRPSPPGAWQFEGHRCDTGGSDLYALYLGAEAA